MTRDDLQNVADAVRGADPDDPGGDAGANRHARLLDRVCRSASADRGAVDAVVAHHVDRLAPLATVRERSHLVRDAIARLDGLDVLQRHLDDLDVDEIMVNGGAQVWIDRCGRVSRVDDLGPGVIDVILERVLAPAGQRIDRTNPVVDARLPDGSRICAVVAPVAVDGTTVSIRRHRPRRFTVQQFSSSPVASLLGELVAARANVLVTGATSTGKTSLLGALLALTPPGERLLLIEDTAEITVAGSHCVRLEARRASNEGIGEIDLTLLVRTALRLRPDRLVIGEFRGDEVVAVVQALNTGHDGSLSTCHANSAIDGLRRVETLVMQAAPAWPLAAIRRQVSRSIDVVVHVGRDAGGRRSVTEIVEVVESDLEPSGRLLADRDGVVGLFRRGRR